VRIARGEEFAIMKNRKPESYEAADIQVLKGLEAVRRRPGMFIGSTDKRGLHHLVYEVVNNSIDEAMAGFCDRVIVTIHKDKSVTVEDNGRGIPVGIHEETGKSALEVVHTMLHAGAKFGGRGYKVASGLHGVGVSAVNALSEWLEVEVRRKGKLYRQRYERGVPVTGVEVIGKASGTGTKTSFLPDSSVMRTLDYDFDTLAQRFREMAFLTKGLLITLFDERFEKEMSFYFEGGIRSFVRYLTRFRELLHPEPIFISSQVGDTLIEVAMQYHEGVSESVYSFANNINTVDGGTHLTGFRAGLTRTLNDYARRKRFLKPGEDNFSGEDVREGLTAIISVKLLEPQFESQTKAKLGNAEVKGQVESVVVEGFSAFLEENPRLARAIIQKCLTATRARAAARKARDLVIRRSVLESTTLPGKLADCSERDPARCELFIVEGDSAGGCFCGDTKVALADGRRLSFKEIIKEQKRGIEHFCYTIRRDGKIGLEKITNPRLTRKNAEVVKVILDNGEEVICTPDHLFMLRDGSYKQAKDLTPSDSLMPLRTKLSNMSESGATIQGYEMVWDSRSESWLFTEAAANLNCKVVAVHWLAERRDVYDITVDCSHNFALAAGVFVHNSAKQGRDRRFQAILPLRGKIMNTEGARLIRILSSKELKALISALGTGIGENFNPSNLRYSRIIIATDADVDGAHITTLLLTFFFRYMRPLIEYGHLFIAQPPLYRITYKGVKGAKRVYYAYTESEKEKIIKKLKSANVSVQRYKGLGEMNPEQLWETTMDPSRRVILQVTIEDAASCDRTFDMLMGSSVPPRRRFIQTHAKDVRNLDV
jgi:DNA gyrase subunit B